MYSGSSLPEVGRQQDIRPFLGITGIYPRPLLELQEPVLHQAPQLVQRRLATRVIPDSNAYSLLMRGNGRVVDLVRGAEEVLLPAIVAGELMYGYSCFDK